MRKFGKQQVVIVIVSVLALVAIIFVPGDDTSRILLTTELSDNQDHRAPPQQDQFTPQQKPTITTTTSKVSAAKHLRTLIATDVPNEESLSLTCPSGQVERIVDWRKINLVNNVTPQAVTLSPFRAAVISYKATAPSYVSFFGFDDTGYLKITAGTNIDASITSSNPNYPAGYGSMIIHLNHEIQNPLISVGDVDSNANTCDVVRIRMYDSSNTEVSTTVFGTGTIRVVTSSLGNFGYEPTPGNRVNNPGFASSLYAKANGKVKRIELDQSVFAYKANLVGSNLNRSIYPSLEFKFCEQEIDSPSSSVPSTSPTPVPTVPTLPPTLAVGINGDPLMMGLSGQVFKFDGRPGGWYSAVSTHSFQWNIKVQKFEGCPNHSNSFIVGTGLTILKNNMALQEDSRQDQNKYHQQQAIQHTVSVDVGNEYSTDIGCGQIQRLGVPKEYGCLGAGSLGLLIDGHRFSKGGNYRFLDGSGRVVAFNTISKCSRRWFDFKVTPRSEIKTPNRGDGIVVSRRRRRLETTDTRTNTTAATGKTSPSLLSKNVLDILEKTKRTMIDWDGCKEWLKERRAKNDLFEQTGTWSTVMIITDTVSFHIEYKQEQERCNAHSLDMWISSVNPKVLAEQWEGIIGETKKYNQNETHSEKEEENMEENSQKLLSPFFHHHPSSNHTRVKRKYDDEAYEVISPFSLECKACIDRKGGASE